ncbi:MAG: hypothetical protein V1847_05020 [Candidatus Diapherotrites archaeon]
MIDELEKTQPVTVICRSPPGGHAKIGNIEYIFCESRALQELKTAELLSKRKFDCTYLADLRLAGFTLNRLFKRKNAGTFIAAVASLHSFSNKIVDQPEVEFLAREEETFFPYVLEKGNIDYLHVSCKMAEKLFKKNFQTAQTFVPQHIGISEQHFPQKIDPPADSNRLLIASRNRPRKRIDMVEEMARNNPMLNFSVCGLETRTESQAPNVKYLGLLMKDMLFEEMKKSGFTVSLSVHEVFANTLTEAACFGSIPVYPKIDPIQDELFQKIGVGVNEEDFLKLGKKIEKIDVEVGKKQAFEYAQKNFNATKNVPKLYSRCNVAID